MTYIVLIVTMSLAQVKTSVQIVVSTSRQSRPSLFLRQKYWNQLLVKPLILLKNPIVGIVQVARFHCTWKMDFAVSVGKRFACVVVKRRPMMI